MQEAAAERGQWPALIGQVSSKYCAAKPSELLSICPLQDTMATAGFYEQAVAE